MATAIGLTSLTVGTALTQGFLERLQEARILFDNTRSAVENLRADRTEALLQALAPAWREVPSGQPGEEIKSVDGMVRRFSLDRTAILTALVYHQRYVLVVGLIGFLVAVELAVFLAYSLTRPMKILAWGCEQMRSGRWVRLPQLSRSSYELEALHEAFNQMVDNLRQWQDFQKEAARVERLAALGSVAAAVAHEVKNPLASMRIRLDLLRNSISPENAEHLAVLGSEVDRLNQTVSQLLAYARPGTPLFGPVAPGELLVWTEQMTAASCSAANIRLLREVEANCPSLWGDAQQLKQVLLNLTLNAVSAQPEGGRILLRAFRHKNGIALSVTDEGTGIPAELLERIFDPFFTTRPEGTGLGLSIVHRIVEGHGGTVSVDTSSKGTTFTVVLPATTEQDKER
jgi:signal transduction histidine kinase